MRTSTKAMLFILAGCGAVVLEAGDRYVAHNGQVETPPYVSWAGAASNIQAAVSVAAVNDTVWVGAGLYTLSPNATNYDGPNVVYINRPLTLRSSNSVPESTIIDGGGVNRGIMVYYNTTTTNRFVIDGFTITNCHADSNGGGIFFDPNRPSQGRSWTGEVYNCILANNNASTNGGGMYAVAGGGSLFSIQVTNCLFRANWAVTNSGGGIYVSTVGAGLISQCRFENNMATNGGGSASGGGVSSSSLQPLTYEYTVFAGNGAGANGSAGVGGGGMRCAGANHAVILRDCLLYGNFGNRGGGINFQQDDGYTLEIYNSTIVSNTASGSSSAGIYLRSGSGVFRIYNSIVASNRFINGTLGNIFVPATGWEIVASNNCSFPTNMVIQLASANITNDPRFVDFPGQNFRLQKESPCVNAGTNQGWMAGAVDLDGKSRIDQSTGLVDMGCYEYVYAGGTLIMVR